MLNCVNSVISILKIVFNSRISKKLPGISGDRCLVLGNGPSLAVSVEKHPTYFTQHPAMCINLFSLSDEFAKFKPLYYVIVDPYFWQSDDANIHRAIDAISEKTKWTMHLMIPHAAKKSSHISHFAQHPHIRLHYFNYVVFKGFPAIGHFFYRRNMAMIQSSNVLVTALFLSINLGYKRVELFGADHSWHEQIAVNENNELVVKDLHFYDEESEVKAVPFTALHLPDPLKMDETFDLWARVFYSYRLIRGYAKKQNCNIYNASEKSYIDAFDRIRIQ